MSARCTCWSWWVSTTGRASSPPPPQARSSNGRQSRGRRPTTRRSSADEPTGNLDSVTAEDVFTLFQFLVDGGRTVVVVTHDHDLAARTRRIVHMVDGRILDGTLPEPAPT